MEFQPAEAKKFFSTVRKEMALLATSLPDGIMVKTFEDRMVNLPCTLHIYELFLVFILIVAFSLFYKYGKQLWKFHKKFIFSLINLSCCFLQDLFSAFIKGPNRTPYEDGLFLFDIQLPNIYPAVPPLFRYLSQCSGRLNPNLYDNGKVCVSLLGTWIGKVSWPTFCSNFWLVCFWFSTSHLFALPLVILLCYYVVWIPFLSFQGVVSQISYFWPFSNVSLTFGMKCPIFLLLYLQDYE